MIKKILIVEDELLIAKVLRIQLEKMGYIVENVSDGNIAFEKVQEMQPDIIIMDVYLKNNTTGIDAGKKIRKAGIQTPILYTTGNSYDSTMVDIKEITKVKLLIKPVDFENLISCIKHFN